jgi:hypothetical protein
MLKEVVNDEPDAAAEIALLCLSLFKRVLISLRPLWLMEPRERVAPYVRV